MNIKKVKEVGFLVVLLSLAIVALIPFAAIWSINTLFSTDIEYTWKTWLASVFLIGLLKSTQNN